MCLVFGLFQTVYAFDEEIRFIEGLTERGFPKLADKVLFRTLEKHPAAKDRAPELQIRILIASKQFDAAAKQIRSQQSEIDNAPDLWLFLAESSTGDSAMSAYKNYFSLTQDPNDQAAFNYGTLLEERGDIAAAISLYERVDSRPTNARLAALLVESDPDRALKLAEDVQLGGLDIWFGQAVVTWAQLMIDRGEVEEAQAVLETQIELLKQISDSATPSAAPVAGGRYFLGVCYEQAGRKAEALTQFYNVYAKYGDSDWGPQAKERADALIAYFQAQGKTVKIDPGANLAKMEQSRFRIARRLFFDRQYAEAIPAYLDALNEYPEGGEALTALRELTLSYLHLGDTLHAKAVAAYTGERFSGREAAANALLAAGKTALDQKQNDLAWWMYDQYFKFFPTHARAPAVLYSLAGLRKDERYLKRILDAYPDSPYAARARGRLAWRAFEAKDYALAAERFEKVIETENDAEKQTRARFALGESYRNQARNFGSVGDVAPPMRSKLNGGASLCERAAHTWKQALKNFQALEKTLIKAEKSFGVSAETLEFNKPFIEKSFFYQGACLAALGRTDEAVAAFDRFIENFQGSEFIEQAHFAKGSALMDAGRWAVALAAFEPFDEFSDRRFLEPVLYYRGQALAETGQNTEAIQSLETLLNRWPESAFFFEAKFVQGRAYAAAGQNEEAVRVLSDILSFASDDELMHRASLALGRAQTEPSEQLASFQRVALLADPDLHSELIAEALFESLPLYLELARCDDLLADADRLLSEFPMFGKTEEISLLKTKAEAALEQQKEKTANERE
jgi:tetratricopeptide (TPR) repeat protein